MGFRTLVAGQLMRVTVFDSAPSLPCPRWPMSLALSLLAWRTRLVDFAIGTTQPKVNLMATETLHNRGLGIVLSACYGGHWPSVVPSLVKAQPLHLHL